MYGAHWAIGTLVAVVGGADAAGQYGQGAPEQRGTIGAPGPELGWTRDVALLGPAPDSRGSSWRRRCVGRSV